MPTAEAHPITVVPGLHRLFLDYCQGADAVRPFYPALGARSQELRRPELAAHRPQLIEILGAQNPGAAPALAALAQGAGAVVTGQQVGLFGGPLFTPFKAATALARARTATAAGQSHVAIFWLATEDHDFAEINHVTFPARRELRKLVYDRAPAVPQPVGGVLLDESIQPLLDQASELLGHSDAFEALAAAYQPGRSFAEAFAGFYARIFAAQGLLLLDAGGRECHRLGAPVLRAALERADELHMALVNRNAQLVAAGYHAQVAVAPQSSLLFLIDEKSGARLALKRKESSPEEPKGLWQAGKQNYSTEELAGILDSEPERISPSALLRPVFQDFLLSTSLTIAGPAELAYFAQSEVLFERILGRATPAEPRFSATLIEPSIADLLNRHELTLERIFSLDQGTPAAAQIAQLLAARSLPIEAKQKLAAVGNALEAELDTLLAWMHRMDAGLGKSGDTAAGKIRYQMDRLRRLAADSQLQREGQLVRHAEAIAQALYPGNGLQERLHGAAFYFARYGAGLAEELTRLAASPGHTVIRL